MCFSPISSSSVFNFRISDILLLYLRYLRFSPISSSFVSKNRGDRSNYKPDWQNQVTAQYCVSNQSHIISESLSNWGRKILKSFSTNVKNHLEIKITQFKKHKISNQNLCLATTEYKTHYHISNHQQTLSRKRSCF